MRLKIFFDYVSAVVEFTATVSAIEWVSDLPYA